MDLTLPISDVVALLPQRPPFVMVDTLLYADAESSKCTLTITADNIFVEDGKFNEAGLLEHIAQTAAAGAGYNAAVNNRPVTVGYIGAVKNFEIISFPKVGDRLVTEVRVASRVFDVLVITGSIKCNEVQIASCEMRVFTQNSAV
ncbi:MAG: 3-hydroxyacyl-ACP dehydratase [Flavipsychrobacter sp.]|nr:3-hydroxyacyl-ACP dehydratase [Flavipsychrobacter sp.]